MHWGQHSRALKGKTLQEARQPAATAGTLRAQRSSRRTLNGWPEPEMKADAGRRDRREGAQRRLANFYEKWRGAVKL